MYGTEGRQENAQTVQFTGMKEERPASAGIASPQRNYAQFVPHVPANADHGRGDATPIGRRSTCHAAQEREHVLKKKMSPSHGSSGRQVAERIRRSRGREGRVNVEKTGMAEVERNPGCRRTSAQTEMCQVVREK